MYLIYNSECQEAENIIVVKPIPSVSQAARNKFDPKFLKVIATKYFTITYRILEAGISVTGLFKAK